MNNERVKGSINLRSPSCLQQIEWLEQLSKWLEIIAEQYGYFGIFFVSFLGAASIIIPIPYTIIIFTIGSSRIFDPFLIAISGAAGSTVGEFFGYFLGYYGRVIMRKEKQKKMKYVLRIFSRYGALSIFLFALTPLPDDLLFIPLGIMRYSLLKALVPTFAGKLLMCFILSYGGYFSIGFIESIFGNGGFYAIIISAILLFIIIVVMLKVDWEKFFALKEK
ncbi:MAG: YqaA family protein [Thermoproteota archaeon]